MHPGTPRRRRQTSSIKRQALSYHKPAQGMRRPTIFHPRGAPLSPSVNPHLTHVEKQCVEGAGPATHVHSLLIRLPCISKNSCGPADLQPWTHVMARATREHFPTAHRPQSCDCQVGNPFGLRRVSETLADCFLFRFFTLIFPSLHSSRLTTTPCPFARQA